MRTRNARPPGRSAWKRGLGSPLAAFAASAIVATSAGAAPVAVTNYRVIQLSPAPATVDINAKGQVAFSEFIPGGLTRARFYDGSSVRDLGTLGGPSAFTSALNDVGQVVGGATLDAAGEVFHAFRWSKATGLVDISRPGMGNSSGSAINNKGWVVGAAQFAGPRTPYRAFRWTSGTGAGSNMVDLGSFSLSSGAFAINEAGTIAGESESPEGGILYLPVRWTGTAGPQALPGSVASVASRAFDINEAGQMVGSTAFDSSLNDRAFLWSPREGLVSLVPPAYLSWAERINERGLVIGQIYDGPVDPNGFIWSRDFGLLRFLPAGAGTSRAGDLNNQGQVVGSIDNRAVVWTRGQGFVDLNTRIPGAPPELELTHGEGISDNGSIVATGNTGLVLLVPSAAYQQPPVSGPVKLSGTPRAGALLSFSAGFKDVDVRESHTAVWSWGDGSQTAGTVSEKNGAGSVSGQHAYRAAGIYTVKLTVTDSSGKSSTVQRTVVVCASGAAMIAGEGSFASLPGASRLSSGTGIAQFAFLSEGNGKVAVQFDVAGMAFRSTKINSVTLDDARVRYSGTGTVNGKGSYRFTLAASAGSGSRDGRHRFGIRISHIDPVTKAEVVDYDNLAAGREGSAANAAGTMLIGAQ